MKKVLIRLAQITALLFAVFCFWLSAYNVQNGHGIVKLSCVPLMILGTCIVTIVCGEPKKPNKK